MKVAFDENIPAAMVRMFRLFAAERQLQYLVRGLEIAAAKDYAPAPDDDDYERKSDVPWIRRFSKDGGKAIISGNTKMRRVPHERLALLEEEMVVIFFENSWSEWKFYRKCALLLFWWPEVVQKIRSAAPGSFYHIPSAFQADGKLRRVSNADLKRLKVEKQVAAQPKKAAERRRRRKRALRGRQAELPFPPAKRRGQ